MKSSEGYKRHKVGTAVQVDGRPATVVRHGRDTQGCYTEVRFADGAVERYHRSQIKPAA